MSDQDSKKKEVGSVNWARLIGVFVVGVLMLVAFRIIAQGVIVVAEQDVVPVHLRQQEQAGGK